MHRSDWFEHVLGSIPRISEGYRDKIYLAVRGQRKPEEGLTEVPMVPTETFGDYVERVAEDSLDAVRAAMAMAKRFQQPVVIQEDLSVVFKKHANKRILETFEP